MKKMAKHQKITLLLIIGLLISCMGCTSASYHNNRTIASPTTLTPFPSSVSGATFATCPPSENSSPWIHLDPVTDHVAGEKFDLTGTTNLKRGEILSVLVYQSPPSPNKKMPSEFTDVRGSVVVQMGDCNANTWSYSDNLTTLRPSLYTIDVTAENATTEANLVQFNIIDSRSPPS